MKRLFFIFFVLILISNTGCIDTTEENFLSNNRIIKKYFSRKDIKELNSIVYFFDKKVLDNCESDEIDSCYKVFLYNFRDSLYNKGNFGMDTTGFQMFCKTLPKSFSSEIWYYTKGTSKKTSLDTVKEIVVMNILTNGNYIEFLKDYSKINVELLNYLNPILKTGTLSPSSSAFLYAKYRKFDFNDEAIRLIYGIHFLIEGSNLLK